MSWFKWAAAGVVAVVAAATVSACGPADVNGGTALVVGNRQHVPEPQILGNVEAALTEAADRGDSLVLVSVSGDPTVAAKDTMKCPYTTGAGCDQFAREARSKLAELITKYPATSTEADLLGAVNLARDSLASLDGPKQIIVIDSGISTTGALPLARLDVLDDDPQQLAKEYVAKGLVRSLDGYSVVLSGMGRPTHEQPLADTDRAKLVALYRSILTAAGARVEVDETPYSNPSPPAGARPKVTIAKRLIGEVTDPCAELELSESQIGFVPDEATFVDRGRARSALSKFAARLRKSGLNVVLTGTTAYKESGPGSLSLERAEAVESVLVELKVSKAKILTQGVGTAWPGYRDPKGNPVLERQMRLVILQPTCVSR